MKTTIQYNVCRGNLGDDTTNAQFAAFKKLVHESISDAFPNADVRVDNSDFANASTCNVSTIGDMNDDDEVITRNDVEEAASNVGESWWDAK